VVKEEFGRSGTVVVTVERRWGMGAIFVSGGRRRGQEDLGKEVNLGVAGNVGWQRDLFLERVVIGWGWEVWVRRCTWSERGGRLSKRGECSWGDTEGGVS
jgi:hypothetical protein